MNNNNKILIEQRFTKALNTYKNNATIQIYMAKKLLALIKKISNKENFKDVFEFGCGCGLLTNEFIKRYNYKTYLTNDIVEKCSDHVLQICEKIEFIYGDIEQINIDKKFDLIISNATFQWLNNPSKTIKTLISCLKPNGILAFTTFGINNFQELKQLDHGLDYMDIKSLKSLFGKKQDSLFIEEEIKILEFKTPYEVLKHIKLSGVNAIGKTFFTKSKLNKLINDYYKYFKIKNKQSVSLTYHPIFIIFSNVVI